LIKKIYLIREFRSPLLYYQHLLFCKGYLDVSIRQKLFDIKNFLILGTFFIIKKKISVTRETVDPPFSYQSCLGSLYRNCVNLKL